MIENVITIEECRQRAQQNSFTSFQNMERGGLRLVTEDEPREVSVVLGEYKWKTQPVPPTTRRTAYIFACLPLVLTIIYMVLAYSLDLW